MKIENVEVYGFRAAFRGMRSPLESWDRSDSVWTGQEAWSGLKGDGTYWCIETPDCPVVGPKDLQLACKLIKGGSEHRKFLRQIMVWFDITIPRYVWTELDTYKVATVRNSCSTMHKLGTRDLTMDDFELPITIDLLQKLNEYGKSFRFAKTIKDNHRMNEVRRAYKNILPEGFLQKATFSMNYETALSMYFQRKNHRLPEWKSSNPSSITSFIAALPYMDKFIEACDRSGA